MRHSDFIFISAIALALCESVVSNASRDDMFPVYIQKIPQTLVSGNATIEFQTTFKADPEVKSLEKEGNTTPEDKNVIEIKQSNAEVNTTQQQSETSTTKQSTSLSPRETSTETVLNLPFRRRRMSDVSIKPENKAPSKIKLKLKLAKTKAELKEKVEASKNNNFPKDLEKRKGTKQDTQHSTVKNAFDETNKYMPHAANSKEVRDNVKREQLLQWLYNARPLLNNETRLWANIKTVKSKTSDNDHNKDVVTETLKDIKKSNEENKKQTEIQTRTDNKKSDENKKEAEFHTVEIGSEEEKTRTTKKREEVTKTDKPVTLGEESTTIAAMTATNESEESDSSTENGSHLESTKSKEIKSKDGENKAKIASTKEPDTDMTSDETAEDVTEKKESLQKQNDRRTVQRFAPNDGPSSSESGSI